MNKAGIGYNPIPPGLKRPTHIPPLPSNSHTKQEGKYETLVSIENVVVQCFVSGCYRRSIHDRQSNAIEICRD